MGRPGVFVGSYQGRVETIIKRGKKIKLSEEEIEQTRFEKPVIDSRTGINQRTHEVHGDARLFANARGRVSTRSPYDFFNVKTSVGKVAEKKVIEPQEEIIKQGDPTVHLTEKQVLASEKKKASYNSKSWITNDMLSKLKCKFKNTI